MKPIFDFAGQTITSGIYLRARFELAKYGVIDIHTFKEIMVDPQIDRGVDLRIFRDMEWVGAQEPIKYPDKSVEPYRRSGPTGYISYSFDQLDEIPISNGSRFLSLKKVRGSGITTTHANDDLPNQEIAVVLSDRKELFEYLETVLFYLGASTGMDILLITKDIFAKMFIS